jgi:hypothetical protein
MMCEPVSGSAQVHITAIAVPYAVRFVAFDGWYALLMMRVDAAA